TPPDGATAPTLTSKDRRRVAFASTIGTTIEFYDFYIYATAAVAVFPLLFFRCCCKLAFSTKTADPVPALRCTLTNSYLSGIPVCNSTKYIIMNNKTVCLH